MPKILIPGIADFENRGGMAILIGLITCLRSNMPTVDITLFSRHPAKHKEFERLGIEIRQYPWLRESSGLFGLAYYSILMPLDFLRCFLCRLAGRFKKSIKSPYEQYDVVIPIIVDGLSDSDHGPLHVIQSLVQELFSQFIIQKPRATIPTDLGPFKTKLTKWLARFVFNRIDVLALRDIISYKYAKLLGLSRPKIYLCSDLSFLMEPPSKEKVDQILRKEGIIKSDKPLIGFSPSKDQTKVHSSPDSKSREERQSKYIELMAATTDYLVDKLGAFVCLIPHVYPDDKEVSYQIWERVKNKHDVVLLQGEYLADELKGIIGSCDMFIGCRMHAAIASTSLGVPTLAIAAKDKFNRLIGHGMGQEEYVINILNLSYGQILDTLKTKVDNLWVNRDKVKEDLRERAKIAQERAVLYGKLIQELVESSNSS